MLRLLMHFLESAQAAVQRGVAPDDISSLPILRRLRRLGEEMGEEQIATAKEFWKAIDDEFHELQGDASDES